MKNIEKYITIKDNLVIQRPDGGSFDNLRVSTLQYIIITLKEIRKDIKKYPKILDIDPNTITNDDDVLFMVYKYCTVRRRTDRYANISICFNNAKRSLFSIIRNCTDEQLDRIIYDIKLFIFNK